MLAREAKRRNISTTDEIARRIDESFKYRDWRDERERLIAAAFADLRAYPNPGRIRVPRPHRPLGRGRLRDTAVLLPPLSGREPCSQCPHLKPATGCFRLFGAQI